jgi:replication factor C small subunit
MLLSETTRPRNLQSIIGQSHVISKLQDYKKDPWNIPHMIFSGPPGCGKTSAIYAYALEVYKKDFDRSVRFMNLSGERSVQTIIKKVHSVCKYYHERKGTKGLFVCDEADCMTSEAQDIMVHCVKLYEKRWTFVFIMNRLSDISPMLAEVCEIHQFLPIQDPSTLLRTVLPKDIGPDTIQKIQEYYSGDLRRILNASQGIPLRCDGFHPEWEGNSSYPERLRMLRTIKSAIHKHVKDMPVNFIKQLMEISIGLHRPGSIRAYAHAYELAIKEHPNFFLLSQDEHNITRGGEA